MRRARLFFSLLVPALLAQAPLAAAADPHNAEQATRDFNKGLELMKSGHPDDARIKFVEANGLVRSTDILWNLILAEAASEHYADAVNHAYQLMRDPNGKKENISYLTDTVIPQAQPKVGLIEIEAPTGAQVEIDSKEKVGHAPIADPFAVVPGPHEVVAILDNDRLTKGVEVGPGQRVHVTLGDTKAVPPPATAAATTVDVSTILERPDPTAQPPATHTPDSQEASQRAARRNWTIGLGATAVALGVTSVVLFAVAKGSDNTVNQDRAAHPPGTCPDSGCPDLDSALHSERTEATAAILFGAGAGAFAVAGAVTWFALRPHEHPDHVGLQIVPTFGPGSTGVLLKSAF